VERIWRREGLKVPRSRSHEEDYGSATAHTLQRRPEHQNHVWSYDVLDYLITRESVFRMHQAHFRLPLRTRQTRCRAGVIGESPAQASFDVPDFYSSKEPAKARHGCSKRVALNEDPLGTHLFDLLV
jgi:hypothetical protein